MDKNLAIQIIGLGKQYRIGALQERERTLAETLTDSLGRPWQVIRSITRREPSTDSNRRTFWALKDITFDVQRGEVVGIIGRNGAGKSTLLKILTRITNPTEGRVRLRGRVGSLLEVGTGFHAELTGRENTYLNGAILGMNRQEIDRKFDEIVAFSGVEKFIDTPVKHYSSGMYLRLAFAVAAHLEPDILLVDEVLAVGDAEFQRKCLGKMSDVAGEGRTVLLVSHNMAAIQSLCSRAILLDSGRAVQLGSVDEVLSVYLSAISDEASSYVLDMRDDRVGGDVFRFTHVEVLHADSGQPLTTLISGQPVLMRLHYRHQGDHPLASVQLSVAFRNQTDQLLFACRSDAVGKTFDIEPGEGMFDVLFPRWPLSGGRYSFNVQAMQRGGQLDWVRQAGVVYAETGDYYGTGIVPAASHQSVFIDFDWRRPVLPDTGSLSAFPADTSGRDV